MYIVTDDDDRILGEFRSPVAAELFVKELARKGIEAYVRHDEGSC